MSIIHYIGMDVHKENYTLCHYTIEEDEIKYEQKIAPDYKLILKYIEKIRRIDDVEENTNIVCGYEAGCLGYSLYHELKNHGVESIILAPSTMAITNTHRVKTDRLDAGNIARCLAFHTYSAVHVPTEEDNRVKEYIRMRDSHKKQLTSLKLQISAFVLRHGHRFAEGKNHWTARHLNWLRSLKPGELLQDCLDEYLVTYQYLVDKIERFDKKIEELASGKSYQEKVKKLSCLLGVKTHTALATICEISDFDRFPNAENFAAYLGLVPSENSSGGKVSRGSITKAGNSHVRRLLIESAQSYTRGVAGYKSKELKRRQDGNTTEVIAYADRANERLRTKFYRMTRTNGVKRNIATTAVARELACFMWGLMTNHVA